MLRSARLIPWVPKRCASHGPSGIFGPVGPGREWESRPGDPFGDLQYTCTTNTLSAGSVRVLGIDPTYGVASGTVIVEE
jgi:hypothetical protein